MPRGKRLNIIGGVYHLYTRGIERRAIFKDDKDKEEFLARLADALKKTKSLCYAWTLMPNHIHLLLTTEKTRQYITVYAKIEGTYRQTNHTLI